MSCESRKADTSRVYKRLTVQLRPECFAAQLRRAWAQITRKKPWAKSWRWLGRWRLPAKRAARGTDNSPRAGQGDRVPWRGVAGTWPPRFPGMAGMVRLPAKGGQRGRRPSQPYLNNAQRSREDLRQI